MCDWRQGLQSLCATPRSVNRCVLKFKNYHLRKGLKISTTYST